MVHVAVSLTSGYCSAYLQAVQHTGCGSVYCTLSAIFFWTDIGSLGFAACSGPVSASIVCGVLRTNYQVARMCIAVLAFGTLFNSVSAS